MARKRPLGVKVGNAFDVVFTYKGRVESGTATKDEKRVYNKACATIARAQSTRVSFLEGVGYIILILVVCILFWLGAFHGVKLIFQTFVQSYTNLAYR